MPTTRPTAHSIPPDLQRFIEAYHRLHPVTATFTGVHAHDGRLPDWSLDGLDIAVAEMRALRADLQPSDELSEAGFPDQVDRHLADAFLEIQIAEIEGPHFQRSNPALFTGEAIFGILALTQGRFASASERWPSVAARLDAIPVFLAAVRETIGSHEIPPCWIERAIRECQGATTYLGAGVDRWLSGTRTDGDQEAPPDSARRHVRAGADRARAAFQELASWLRDGTRVSGGGYGCGPDFFDLVIRRGHACQRTRHDLLEEAREHLLEASARLAERARRLSPGGWPKIRERLAEHHPSLEEYSTAHERVWRACREVADGRRLVSWPDAPIRFEPIPPHARAAAAFLYYLLYRSPAPGDDPSEHVALVPPLERGMSRDEQVGRLRGLNHSVIKLNHVVHHAAIGHHVQNTHAARSRSCIGRIAAVDGASRIGMFCGGSLAEGWACYATDLMEEVGFFSGIERVAQQHARVRQLARAVVDIELHQNTMSFEQAEAFHRDRVGMTPEAARAETVKSSMFPGTAIMYWLGTDGLHRLRAERARVEGPAFSLRGFHDRLLAYGSIPVAMLDTLMRRTETDSRG